ncbi:MAG: hypothetical protein AAFU79_31420, partial [Myxococcota bacterium]
GRYTRPEYSTVSVKGLNAPPFWQQKVPAAGGGLRPVDGLLDHLVSLQGVNTSVDGHETCQRLHWQPITGLQSRLALAADASAVPLPAVSIQAVTLAFQSLQNKSVVPLAELGPNPLTELLRPFLANLPATVAGGSAGLDAVLQRLDEEAVAWSGAAAETRASQRDALALFRRNFGDLGAIYETRRAVYRDLIARSLSNNHVIPGVTDLPIGPSGTAGLIFSVDGEGSAPELGDYREAFGAETAIEGLAEQFAVVEYLLKEDLSRSVAIGARGLSGLQAIGEQDFDEHGMGSMISVLLNMKWYTAFSACLLEFFDQLKTAQIFRDTVVEVSGEFGRSARPDGSGSDHGWPGKMTSFYSGLIQGPLVLGNIYSTPPANSGFDEYPGTWGYGAPVDGVQSVLGLSHELATLATMLGVPSPTNAAPSLVAIEGGRIVAAPGVERARIVRG